MTVVRAKRSDEQKWGKRSDGCEEIEEKWGKKFEELENKLNQQMSTNATKKTAATDLKEEVEENEAEWTWYDERETRARGWSCNSPRWARSTSRRSTANANANQNPGGNNPGGNNPGGNNPPLNLFSISPFTPGLF